VHAPEAGNRLAPRMRLDKRAFLLRHVELLAALGRLIAEVVLDMIHAAFAPVGGPDLATPVDRHPDPSHE
jgi:hypothetical protein